MRLREFGGLLSKTFSNWVDHAAPRLGAAVSYYTIFALPPLFVIAIFVASLVFDPAAVRGHLFSEVGGLIGKEAAKAIESAMAMQNQGGKGPWATAIAIVALLITSTGLFIELQGALNTIWGVRPKPGHTLRDFMLKRVLSFAMVVGSGFLLLVSLIVSTVLSALSNYIGALIPGLDAFWLALNYLVSLGVFTLLFALMFKLLPDVRMAWRDVWLGSVITALLFAAGKFLLGYFLGSNQAVSAYGAAGSVLLVLLWVYYSAQILFFGAELTRTLALHFGCKMVPKGGAEWVPRIALAGQKPGLAGQAP